MSILNTIRISAIVTCSILAACDGIESSAVPNKPLSDPQAANTVNAEGPTSTPVPMLYTPLSNLNKIGLEIQTLDGHNSMICGSGGSDLCMCVETLPCESEGSCPTFESHVDSFRRALNNPPEGTKVHCDRAEIGHCGVFRYFAFRGDFHRFEILWFDEDGQLFSQRNWTDHQAYCGERSSIRYQGGLPACDSMVRDELICGEGEKPLQSPMEDVRFNTQSFADRALPSDSVNP